jgi:hypothetical protein
LPYTILDAIASVRLTGKVPRVLQAIRLVPEGTLPGLRPTVLQNVLRIDPRRQDFFQAVIEERKRLPQRADLSAVERERLDAFLKLLANATSYGIFAEMNRHEVGAARATRSGCASRSLARACLRLRRWSRPLRSRARTASRPSPRVSQARRG